MCQPLHRKLESIFVGEKICFEHCFNPSKARFTENVIERGVSLEWERGANIDVIQKLCLFPACCYGWFWIWFNAKSDVTLTIGISFLGEDVDSCSQLVVQNFADMVIWTRPYVKNFYKKWGNLTRGKKTEKRKNEKMETWRNFVTSICTC